MSVVPFPRASQDDHPARRPDSSAPPTSVLLARVANVDAAVVAQLLHLYGSLGALRHADVTTLRTVHGLTWRQATRLCDALDLAAHLLMEPPYQRPQVTSPREAACLLLPEMGLLEQEEMRLLLLDTKNYLISTITLYAGTVNACQVRIAEVFREAVRRNATALIVAHNHPSGVVDPSPEDVRVTKDMIRAGRLMDVDVLDHLIIASEAYTSLRERGLGWE